MTQINIPVNPFVPDAYIETVAPPPVVTGAVTDKIGVVGTASWGPVNAPTPISPRNFAQVFGPVKARTFDLGTAITAAGLAGANNFTAVRVTDGTDAAATVVIGTTGVTITSKYSGTLANSDTVTIAAGSAASSVKVTIARPGYAPEVFDNITGTGNALWVNIAAAINGGQSGVRGPSNLVVATAGASTSAPTNGTSTLTGGTDGVATITTAVMVGVDTGTRTGMYALRGTGPGVMFLADLSDYTSFASQISFCLQEGFYGIGVGPAGEYSNLSTVASNLATAGSDSFAFKVLVGDWAYFLDTTNGNVPRMISPQGFAAGELASLLPFNSGLNKPIGGIVGTQKSYANQQYSVADLQTIGQGRLDLICNPCPGGNYFGLRFGKNCSSNAATNLDNYSRMIPYLEYSFNTVAGQFVGQVITKDQANDAIACFQDFLTGLKNAKPVSWIRAFSVAIDLSQQTTGYEILNVQVQLRSIVLFFVVNLQAGQTVQITTSPAA